MDGLICVVSRCRCSQRQSGSRCLLRRGVCSGSNFGLKIWRVLIGMPFMNSKLLLSNGLVRARNSLICYGNCEGNWGRRMRTKWVVSTDMGRTIGKGSWAWIGCMMLRMIVIGCHALCRVIRGIVRQLHH